MKAKQYLGLFCATAMLTLLCVSCVTPKRVNYLQDMSQGTQIELEDKFEARISAYDELDIYISCYDPELAKPFNIGYQDASRVERRSYLVDVNGNIQLPVLGNLHVVGFTRLQLQDTIIQLLLRSKYMDDPYVRVRFNDFKIFFLGSGGGKAITINNERCTFLEALALSGDLNVYTRRDRIAVMREVNGKMVTRYLDPRSSEVFSDPFFMLQQNDFIITQSSNMGTARSEISFMLSWMSTAVSAVSMVLTLLLYSQLNK